MHGTLGGSHRHDSHAGQPGVSVHPPERIHCPRKLQLHTHWPVHFHGGSATHWHVHEPIEQSVLPTQSTSPHSTQGSLLKHVSVQVGHGVVHPLVVVVVGPDVVVVVVHGFAVVVVAPWNPHIVTVHSPTDVGQNVGGTQLQEGAAVVVVVVVVGPAVVLVPTTNGLHGGAVVVVDVVVDVDVVVLVVAQPLVGFPHVFPSADVYEHVPEHGADVVVVVEPTVVDSCPQVAIPNIGFPHTSTARRRH